MNRLAQAAAMRRFKSSTSRVENQEYNFVPERRTPRLTSSSRHAWCQLTASISPATGTWPSITPQTLPNQTIYVKTPGVGTLTAIVPDVTVYNWRNVTWATGKTTLVLPNGDGTWDIIDQDC